MAEPVLNPVRARTGDCPGAESPFAVDPLGIPASHGFMYPWTVTVVVEAEAAAQRATKVNTATSVFFKLGSSLEFVNLDVATQACGQADDARAQHDDGSGLGSGAAASGVPEGRDQAIEIRGAATINAVGDARNGS